MKIAVAFLIITFVAVECGHTFLGTNVLRPLVYHHNAQYGSRIFQKRVENLYYQIPNNMTSYIGQTIQGILAYDLTNTDASANITQGGLGYNFVNIRMKSGRGHSLHYDIYIYA